MIRPNLSVQHFKKKKKTPPNLAEQETFQYAHGHVPPRYNYGNYYPPYFAPYPPFTPPYIPPQTTPVKITPPKKSGGLKIRDPSSGNVVKPEDLIKDDKKPEVKEETNKDDKKSNIPGIPQEIPKTNSNIEAPSESQDESEPDVSEEKSPATEETQKSETKEVQKQDEEKEPTEKQTEEKAEKKEETPKPSEGETEEKKPDETTPKPSEKETTEEKKDETTPKPSEEGADEKKQDETPQKPSEEETEEVKKDEDKAEKSEIKEEEDEWESTKIKVDNNPIQEEKKPKKITYSREELLKFENLYQPTESTRKASEEYDLSRTKEEPRREFGRGKGPLRSKKSSPFQSKRRVETTLSKIKRPSENRWQRPTGHDDIRLPIRRILNKLTPTLYDSLLEQLLQIKLEDFDAYRVLVELIYEKAIKDTKYTELYARLCRDLNTKFGNLVFDEQTVKFRVLIVNKCAHEFANRESPESIPDTITDPIDREEKINKLKDNLNGMMIFIGELYKQSMIGGKHMINCLSELINKDTQYELEIFSSLYKTLGEKVEGEQKHKEMLSEIHKKMEHISKSKDYPPRIRFMFLDLLDLKKNNFVEKKKF